MQYIRLLLFYSVIFQSVIFQSCEFQSPVHGISHHCSVMVELRWVGGDSQLGHCSVFKYCDEAYSAGGRVFAACVVLPVVISCIVKLVEFRRSDR